MKILKLIILNIVIIAMLFILTGCTSSIAETNSSVEKYENENFIILYNELTHEHKSNHKMIVSIIVDKKTKVMYLDGRPRIDAEGKPLLYKGE